MSQAHVIIIKAMKGGGKTKLASEVAGLLSVNSVMVNGFLCMAGERKSDNPTYTLRCLSGNYVNLLAQRNEVPGWLRLGGFFFDPRVVKTANDCIFLDKEKPGIYILDEIGKLDLEGHLWHDMFSELLKQTAIPILITARDIFVEKIVNHWHLENIHTFDTGRSGAEEIYTLIRTLV